MELEKYYDKIYGFFYKRLPSREDTEDCTMIILEKIFLVKEQNRFLKDKNEWPYIWQMCKNLLTDQYSKNYNLKTTDLENLEIENPKYSLNYQTEVQKLYQNIENYLKKEEANILKSIYFDGFTYSEISAKLGKNETNLRKTVSRAIKKLKKYYEEF